MNAAIAQPLSARVETTEIVLALATVAVFAVAAFAPQLFNFAGATTPCACGGARAAPADLRNQPGFNDQPFGGCLFLAGSQPCIDNWVDLYSGPFLLRHRKIVVPDRILLAATLQRQGIARALLQSAIGGDRYLEIALDGRRL